MTRDYLDIDLVNRTGASMLYGHITGRREAAASQMFVMQADGQTAYDLVSNGQILQPLGVDSAIPIGGPGAKKRVRIPRLVGGRIYFSKNKPLTFLVNPGPALVEPSAMNKSDANYSGAWIFCELTFNAVEVFVNISSVDFVSIPVGLTLQSDNGQVQQVSGFPNGGPTSIAHSLEKLDDTWKKLVIRNSSGGLIRILSPNSALDVFPDIFKGHYTNYVNAVWKKYKTEDLVVDTQRADWGVYRGRVQADGSLHFTGKQYSFDFEKPTTRDIFSCNTGPFAVRPPVDDREQARLNVGARLAAAFNRTTLLTNSQQPQQEDVKKFYTQEPINWYARYCHEVSVGGRGYAFPYDDVLPTGAVDQSGSLAEQNPSVLTVTVGGLAKTKDEL
ncbi:glucanase B [Mariannaea sp. PMI_226]|nr:glucanase B [Mariannaea sp. PMI_226]